MSAIVAVRASAPGPLPDATHVVTCEAMPAGRGRCALESGLPWPTARPSPPCEADAAVARPLAAAAPRRPPSRRPYPSACLRRRDFARQRQRREPAAVRRLRMASRRSSPTDGIAMDRRNRCATSKSAHAASRCHFRSIAVLKVDRHFAACLLCRERQPLLPATPDRARAGKHIGPRDTPAPSGIPVHIDEPTAVVAPKAAGHVEPARPCPCPADVPRAKLVTTATCASGTTRVACCFVVASDASNNPAMTSPARHGAAGFRSSEAVERGRRRNASLT